GARAAAPRPRPAGAARPVRHAAPGARAYPVPPRAARARAARRGPLRRLRRRVVPRPPPRGGLRLRGRGGRPAGPLRRRGRARDAGVRLLALTHLSTRYFARDVRDEARAAFPATVVPRDFDAIEVPFPERGELRLVKPEREPEVV